MDDVVIRAQALTGFIMNQGRVAESLPRVDEMLNSAKATGDAGLLIAGHQMACVCYCYAGEFANSVHTQTRCWTSTTTRSTAILRTSSTPIPKLWR